MLYVVIKYVNIYVLILAYDRLISFRIYIYPKQPGLFALLRSQPSHMSNSTSRQREFGGSLEGQGFLDEWNGGDSSK